MQQYILRRVLAAIPVIWLVTLAVFSLTRLLPGDIVLAMILEAGNVKPEDLQRLREELGLDRPYHEQYISWITGVLRGDLGKSLWTGRSAGQQLLDALPVSVELAFMALIIAMLIAIPMGVITAARQNTWVDYVGRLFAISGISMPSFWIGTMAIIIMSVNFGYLPPLKYTPFFDNPLRNLEQFIWPAAIMGFALSAVTTRMTRSTMLEVLRQDYVRTAWAKGLRERVVIFRHALKNALIPVVTILGMQFSALLGGTVIMETLFALPGVGRLTIDSINQRDYTQLQGNVLFLATVMVTMNMLVDLSYAWFDPRIRYN